MPILQGEQLRQRGEVILSHSEPSHGGRPKKVPQAPWGESQLGIPVGTQARLLLLCPVVAGDRATSLQALTCPPGTWTPSLGPGVTSYGDQATGWGLMAFTLGLTLGPPSPMDRWRRMSLSPEDWDLGKGEGCSLCAL